MHPDASEMVKYYKRVIADDKRQIKIIGKMMCDTDIPHEEETHEEMIRLRKHVAICKENLKEWELYAESKEAWEEHVHDNGRSYGKD